ncbi:MAG: hypothetical protein LUG12_10775 [Erysipelotrichaceae bacterium]|nr:hypothetical protein [Erysipelotrichaceae bacterium]
MIKTSMDFIEFMKQQKTIHNIPDCDNGNYLDMAIKYSLNNNYGIQPDYFTSLYYIALYTIKNYPNLSTYPQFNVYKTSGINEEKMFTQAYNVYCRGRNLKKAKMLMRPLFEMNHVEAIGLYGDILDCMGYNSSNQEFQDFLNKRKKLNNMNILDTIGLCFELYPFAMHNLSFAIWPESASNIPGILKNKDLYKIVNEWLTVIYSKRISRNKNDGFAMTALSGLYAYGGAFADKGHDEYLENAALCERYWQYEALKIRYAPLEFQIATQIAFNPLDNIYTDFIDYNQALSYAQDALDAQCYKAKELIDDITNQSNKQQAIQREIRMMKNNRIETQMQQYRDKLDRQEMFINWIAHDNVFTNEEEMVNSWLTHDYDNASTNYILSMMRENKEKKYEEKLRQESFEDTSYDNHKTQKHDNRTVKPHIKNVDMTYNNSKVKFHENNLYDEIIINQNILPTQEDLIRFVTDSTYQDEIRKKLNCIIKRLYLLIMMIIIKSIVSNLKSQCLQNMMIWLIVQVRLVDM